MLVVRLGGFTVLQVRGFAMISGSSTDATQRLGPLAHQASVASVSFEISAVFRQIRRMWHNPFGKMSRRAGRKGLAARLEALSLGVRRIVYIEDLEIDLVCMPDDLHDRGWSVEAMTRLLGRPDYAITDPTGRRDPIIALDRERVMRVERSSKFRSFMEGRRRDEEMQALRNANWVAFCQRPSQADRQV
jgi:hypothetical protein